MNIGTWTCVTNPVDTTEIYLSRFENDPTQRIAIEMNYRDGQNINYHTAEQVRQMIAALTKALDEIDKPEAK